MLKVNKLARLPSRLYRAPRCFLPFSASPPISPGKRALPHIPSTIASRPISGTATSEDMSLTRSSAPLVWIDCEMTGLDPENDRIIQICCFITDAQLLLLEPNGFERIIHQPKSTLDAMSQWCVDTHGKSGLTDAVLASNTDAATAAGELLAYIKQHVPEQRTALLAGNSIHADRAFLAKGPYAQVLEWLHYRLLDVSSLKEAARRWGSEELLRGAPPKRELHLAKDDILESIAEMKYYREQLFDGR